MKKSLTILFVLSLLAALTPASAAAARSCGDLPGAGARAGYDIVARRLSCFEAKRVVRAFTDEAAIGGPIKRVYVLGWNFKCRTRGTGYESFRTRCAARIGNASFTWGF